MRLAAIDIGSNSIKLIVVEATADDSFAVLAREKEVVRLGHNTLREGRLAPETVERAIDCIARFRSIAEARGAAPEVITVATASVREAENANEFIEEVARRASVRIEVLSSIEEARLIGLAVGQAQARRGGAILNVDIGGGSTEISLVRDGTPSELFSVKLGAVGLTERFITTDPVKPKELRALREEIRAALAHPARELRGVKWKRSTGTSGTILAIGEALRLKRLHRRAEDGDARGAQPAGAPVELNRLERFNHEMARLKMSERRSVPGITAQRSEIIVAGGQILEGVMGALDIESLRTCDWALREGVIINRLREMAADSRPPVQDFADPRLRGVVAIGRRFGFEEAHAHQVTRLSEKIFDRLSGPFKMSRHQRHLLSAAALLHDVGYHIAHEFHHKHSLYLIKHSELTGFSEAERDVIANAARYHRGALPKERHTDYAALNDQDRRTVWRLGAIIRLADALDKSYSGVVTDLSCTLERESVRLQLHSDSDCEKELWAAEQKCDMFEEAFECKLTVKRRALSKHA